MNRRAVLLVIALVACSFLGAQPEAQEENPANPYPGGSPFPPGGEPTLTHVVRAFWTTRDGMATRVSVQAEGNRPSQVDGWKWEKGKKAALGSSIHPECLHELRFAAATGEKRPGVVGFTVEGEGGLEVRVYGFDAEAFAHAPVVTVSYERGGETVGETRVTAQPVPERLKKSPPPAGPGGK